MKRSVRKSVDRAFRGQSPTNWTRTILTPATFNPGPYADRVAILIVSAVLPLLFNLAIKRTRWSRYVRSNLFRLDNKPMEFAGATA